MKKIIIIFLLLLLFLIIKTVVSIPRNQWTDYLKIPDFIQWRSPDALTPPIYGEKSVRQDIIPNFDGLTEIGLSFEWENGPVNVLIRVYQGKNQEHLIYNGDLLLTETYNGKMFRFRFRPVNLSKDKYFSLIIKSPQASADNNLRLYYHRHALHISCRGPLYFDSQKVAGELSLTANCRYDIGKGIFTWAKEKIICDKLFFLSFGAILSGVLGLAIFHSISFKSS